MIVTCLYVCVFLLAVFMYLFSYTQSKMLIDIHFLIGCFAVFDMNNSIYPSAFFFSLCLSSRSFQLKENWVLCCFYFFLVLPSSLAQVKDITVPWEKICQRERERKMFPDHERKVLFLFLQVVFLFFCTVRSDNG